MSLFGKTSNFDKFLEAATSHYLVEPDWASIMNICDCIRQQDVQAKYAVTAIKKKLYAQNPHVVLYAFQVLESVVKNCGTPVHNEIATKQFMEELRELYKTTPHETVKAKILELIQTWAHAFRQEPSYRPVQDTVNFMKLEGLKFPVLKESDAMFAADVAPDWVEGEVCHRCRIQFNTFNRKHHCRNCGQIFCQKCSARAIPIPKFGFEKEVRVCDSCWEKLSKNANAPLGTVPSSTGAKTTSSGTNSEHSSPYSTQNSAAAPTSGGKTEQELREEEELQLAIALSKSEAETKEKAKSGSNRTPIKSESAVDSSVKKDKEPPAVDNELARYLNRSYWEQKQEESHLSPSNQNRNSPVPSAPATSVAMIGNNGIYSPSKLNDTSPSENGENEISLEQFKSNLESTLEIFVNRMKSNSSRGRPISNDTFVQSLFMNITNMHSQLMKNIQDSEDRRIYFEGLQDKIAQIRDARAALDALREEHREKLRREAEEAERLRQIQMAQKLDIMRKKKQEYLQYQRQVAMQRIQEQEREMQLRQEQHKYQLGGGGGMMPPQGVPHYQHQMPPGQVPYMPPPPPQGQPGGPYQVGRGPAPPQHHMGGPPPQQYGPQPFQNQQPGPPQPPPQVVGPPPHYQGYMQGMGGPQMPPHMSQGGPMPPQMMGPPPPQAGGPVHPGQPQGPHPGQPQGPPPQQMVGPMAPPPTPVNQGGENQNQHVAEATLISFD